MITCDRLALQCECNVLFFWVCCENDFFALGKNKTVGVRINWKNSCIVITYCVGIIMRTNNNCDELQIIAYIDTYLIHKF